MAYKFNLFFKISTLIAVSTFAFSTSSYAGFCEEPEQIKFEKYSDILSSDKSSFKKSETYSDCKVMPNDANKAILAFSPLSTQRDNLEIKVMI